MQSTYETLRHRRTQILLSHASAYWMASIALSVVCAITMLLKTPALSSISGAIVITGLSIVGLYSIRYSEQKLTSEPLWSPVPWFFALATANAVLWGLTARNGGLCLSLAIAEAGIAGTYLVSHGRLVMTSIAPIAFIPVPFLLYRHDPFLLQVHLPLMLLIMLASWQGHRLAVRNTRTEMETERLTRLLTDNQADLQDKIKKRTSEIEQANKRLSLEVQLRKEVNQALIQSEEQLNLAMTASGIGFWDWDLLNRKVYHSDIERFFGKEHSMAEDKFSLTDHVLPDDLPVVRKALTLHLKGKIDYYQARYRVLLPNSNQPRWIEDIGRVTQRDNSNMATRMIGTRRDVSKDMQLQEDLSLSSSLFNNSSDGVFVLDQHQQLRTCNRVFCQIFGRQKGELIGMSLFQIIPTEQNQRISQSMISNGRWSGDLSTQRSDNDRFPLSLTLTTIRRDDNSVSHYLGICRDQSESQRNEKEIRYLHNYDKLTGLFNRSYFHEVLRQFRDHSPLQANHYAVCVLT